MTHLPPEFHDLLRCCMYEYLEDGDSYECMVRQGLANIGRRKSHAIRMFLDTLLSGPYDAAAIIDQWWTSASDFAPKAPSDVDFMLRAIQTETQHPDVITSVFP